DNNPFTRTIVASGDALYQMHGGDGSIWRYTGTPMTGWEMLDKNIASDQILADGLKLYQMHTNGSIWYYTGVPPTKWKLLDNNPLPTSFAAKDNCLCQLRKDGTILHYIDWPAPTWEVVDQDGGAFAIAVGSNSAHVHFLYKLRRDGSIWRRTVDPLQPWTMLD